MLPHAPDDGISETYGSSTNGSAIFSQDHKGTPSISLDFSTEYSQVPKRLTIIKDTNRTIWDLNLIQPKKDFVSNGISRNNKKRQNGRIQNMENIQNLDLQTSPLYDPTIFRVCKLFKVGTFLYSAISTGIDDNILIFGRIDPKWQGWDVLKNIDRFSTTENQSEDDEENLIGTLKSPKFRCVRSMQFKSKILGIQTHNINIESKSFTFILIRTSDCIYVLKCTSSDTSFLLTKVFSFEQGTTWAHFAHCNMLLTPNSASLVIVDCIGKFIVFRSNSVKKMMFEKIDLKYGSFYDPVELSNFKKSVWIDPTRLLLFSRTQLFEYKFEQSVNNNNNNNNLLVEKFKCKVFAGTWSKFLDISQSRTNKSLYYVLTTKELIVADTTNGFKRKFAFKHFLNELDTSKFLNILRKPRNTTNDLCVVSSKNAVMNYVIEFNTETFKIVDKPYIFLSNLKHLPLDTDIYQFTIDTCLYLLLQKELSGEISFQLMKFTKLYTDKDTKTYQNSNYKTFMKHGFTLPIDDNTARIIYEKLINYYKFDEKNAPNAAEVSGEIFEKLKSFLDDEPISYQTLFQLLVHIQIPRNIKNIFRIVKHLIANKNEDEYVFSMNKLTWLTDNNIVKECFVDEDNLLDEAKSIVDFFYSFANQERYSTAMPGIILYLLLSLIDLRKNRATLEQAELDDKVDDAMSELPSEYVEMLETFEDDATVAGIMDADDSDVEDATNKGEFTSNMMNMPIVSTSQVPHISVSQSNGSQRNGSNKQLFNDNLGPKVPVYDNLPSSAPNSQQYTQMSQKFSQTSNVGFGQSQSKGPKKKKRKTGF